KQIKYQWIYLSSLSGKKWTNILKQIMDLKLKHPLIKIAWNPGSNQLKEKKKLNKFLSITDVLLLNKEEASELIGTKLSVNNLSKRIVNLGPKIVVITQGKFGANVYNGQQNLHQSISQHRLVDATGAGDAFGAGFVAGLILFDDLKKALDLAIRNSGSVVSKIGAQQGLLNRKILKKYN
ncbi:MAG: carbohydrate kinase family protein, partial [Candidatus Aenigmarchaeota archaeon]|nr:carbohydrate kinase family protein [Candidatus Aenigmarchaeota archaeon]